LSWIARSVIDLADAEPVGIGVLAALSDLGGDGVGGGGATLLHVFDLDTGHRQCVDQLFNVGRQFNKLAQPVE
jgi:hypothetical protein